MPRRAGQPDYERPDYELHKLRFKYNSWPVGTRDLTWKREHTTPQGPTCLLLPDGPSAALVCAHTSTPSWSKKWGRQFEN